MMKGGESRNADGMAEEPPEIIPVGLQNVQVLIPERENMIIFPVVLPPNAILIDAERRHLVIGQMPPHLLLVG